VVCSVTSLQARRAVGKEFRPSLLQFFFRFFFLVIIAFGQSPPFSFSALRTLELN
jgi:hypothetical protein